MYIEFVIADNFLLTYLAAVTATRLCHKRVNVWRCLLASTAGTVAAVFYPLLNVSSAWLFVIKIALGLTLSVILFIKTPRFIPSCLLFFGSTFMFGGACYAVGLVIYSDMSKAAAFSRRCPLFLVLGTGAVVYLIVRYVIKHTRLARARAPYECNTEVNVFGKSLLFSAFMDTGNCVFDDVTGLPVVITNAERFTSKLDNESAAEFIKNVDKFRKMPITTPAGTAKAYLIKPTRITVYSDKQEHNIDAMVGLVQGREFSAEHEMLLGPAVLSEGV